MEPRINIIEKRYNSASEWTKNNFGRRIQKVPVDGGFTCPNRDGKLSKIGCLYCNNKTFTPFYTDEKKSISKRHTYLLPDPGECR